MCAADRQIIDPSELAHKVESGMVLEMSIVLWRTTAFQGTCPRCGHMNARTAAYRGWVEWQVLPDIHLGYRLIVIVLLQQRLSGLLSG
jgi:hypothetical protein